MNAIPSPIEIDPRPCGLCGLTIDRHRMVDASEGPEFYCTEVPVDELTLDELERRAELRHQEDAAAMVRDWEMDDPRDRWRHTGELPPARERQEWPARKQYHTPQSTIDAFHVVLQSGDAERISAWIRNHPDDVPTVLKILEAA